MLGNASKMRALIGGRSWKTYNPMAVRSTAVRSTTVTTARLEAKPDARQWISWIALCHLFSCLMFTLKHGSQALLQGYERYDP